MQEKVRSAIIQSSIVFVSIFATLGLLYGAISNDFKSNYFFLGYMLYYSLPFILACLMGIVSLITEDNNLKLAKAIIECQIAFFITGLMMIIWLASSAVQTAFLPTNYIFATPSFMLPVFEFLVFTLILFAVSSDKLEINYGKRTLQFINYINNWRITKKIKHTSKGRIDKRAALSLAMIILFVTSISYMTTFGVKQTSSIIDSGSAYVKYSNPLNMSLSHSIRLPLMQADQLSIQIQTKDNHQLNYVFLDELDYAIYVDKTQIGESPVFLKQDNGTILRFDTVINETKTYYLLMTGSSTETTNVEYSIEVTKIDASNQAYYFFISVFAMTGFLFIARVKLRKNRTQQYGYFC